MIPATWHAIECQFSRASPRLGCVEGDDRVSPPLNEDRLAHLAYQVLGEGVGWVESVVILAKSRKPL